jgi:hypothetical protein
MDLHNKKKLLTLDFGLDPAVDFYVPPADAFGTKIILKRSGIDKIQHQIKMSFDILTILQTPYEGDIGGKQKVCVTVYGKGVVKEDGRDFYVAKTTASANPDNCIYPNFAEVAEKRCRHRLILQLARLYEHDIFSELESDKFMETRNQFAGAVAEVEKMLNPTSKINRKRVETTDGKKQSDSTAGVAAGAKGV